MFYYKYSKLARWAIALNALSAVIIGAVNFYRYLQISASNALIVDYMKTHNVIRETAIRALEHAGQQLYLSDVSIVVRINLVIATLILLFFFRKRDHFLIAMSAAISCTLLNFVGGAFLFYLIFSGKLYTQTA